MQVHISVNNAFLARYIFDGIRIAAKGTRGKSLLPFPARLMVPDLHGDKYYHPTTMCPRTSITRVRKKGFIGDPDPTDNSAVFYYKIHAERGDDERSSSARQYSLGSLARSPAFPRATRPLRNIFRFEAHDSPSRYMRRSF